MSVAYKLDFPNRLYNPVMGKFTQKDPIGFSGGDVNLYRYVTNSPVNKIDPSGLDWVYSQSTGNLGREDNNLNMSYDVSSGYSGAPGYVNYPKAQNLADLGPIPVGTYQIGQQFTSRRTGVAVLPLTPTESTNTFGRSGFQIHGDNSRGDQSASHGCVIQGRRTRDQIANSSDNIFKVVP